MASDEMDRLGFLLGEWQLEYHIPKSRYSEAGTDTGTGKFQRALDGKYVFFDYSTATGGKAHGIFAWDAKVQIIRYWWFENSGSFQAATCQFLDDDILAMNWHDTVLVQTFARLGPDRVMLRMQSPTVQGSYEPILEVVLTRKRHIA
jgi:hypothetical protein